MSQGPGTPPAPAQLGGQPRGLAVLAVAEGCERFSYYSMQTLLVLYLVKHLLIGANPDHVAGFEWLRSWRYSGLSGQPLSSAIFGDYASLVYLTPILGGLIADRWWGRRRALVVGALVMVAGHLMMAFEASFLAALAALVVGVGLFKGNIASQLGDLYPERDPRRAMGFQIFYIAINVGVIIAPLVSGTLGEKIGWHWGFGMAGVVMALGLAVIVRGDRWLPHDQPRTAASPTPAHPPLTRADLPRLAAIALLVPALAAVVLPNMQIYNAYLVWADRRFDLVAFGMRLPTSWVVTIDAAVSLPLLLASIAFWHWLARRTGREAGEMTRLIVGGVFLVLGALSLAFAAASHPAGAIGLGWPLAFHVLNNLGTAQVMPTSLALFSRIAPRALGATAMGIYYLAFFLSNEAVGVIGGWLDAIPAPTFWLIHAASSAAGLALFVAVRAALGRAIEAAE